MKKLVLLVTMQYGYMCLKIMAAQTWLQAGNLKEKHTWQDNIQIGLNHWVMHPVARESINIYRNLRTQQMATTRGRNM
jgi:hypothetical protein